MQFNVCIIGCGDRGTVHANQWMTRPGASVVAVCDIDTARAEKLAERTGAATYTDYREAIHHDGVNVVCQAVPTYLHAEVACLAAERGCHVFAEKPLALTLEQGRRIVETVERTGIVFVPCFQNRDVSFYNHLRRIYRSGGFGDGPVVFRYTDIRSVRPKPAMHRQSENGGVVIDMSCHVTDLMRYITGAEPERVYAAGHTFGRGKPTLSGVSDFAIDEATMEVTFTGGHQLMIYLHWGLPEGFGPVSGDQFMLSDRLAVRSTPDATEVLHADHKELWPNEPYPGITPLIDRVVAAITDGAPAEPTVHDAMRALEVSHAALQSIDTGRVVILS